MEIEGYYSKIGNYVHWHTQNYLDYGIHHKTDGPSSSASEVLNQSKTKMQESFNTMQEQIPNLAELETRLNWLKLPPKAGAAYRGTGLDENSFNEAWSIFEEVVSKRFQEAVPPRIERELGTIEGIYMPGVHRIKTKPTQKTVSAQKIVNNLKNLQAIINKGSQDNGYSNADIQILQELSEDLEKALENYVEETNSSLMAEGAPRRLTIDKAQPFIDLINKAVAYSTGVANAQRGDLWEDLIAIAALVGKITTREELRKAMEESISTSVLGGERSPVIINGDLFSQDADIGAILGSSYTQKENGFYYSRHQTQNKVDVVIQWDGQDVNISAKNVSLSGPNANQVKIVEAMSLFMGLGNLGNPTLATHYLNQRAHDNGSDLYFQTSQLIKLSLIEQGLRGYKLNNAKADVFIINDNTSGKTTIVSMGRLLTKILDSFPNLEQYTSFNMNPALLDLSEANKYNEAGYGVRITALLAAVHAAKVTIHLKPSLFKI